MKELCDCVEKEISELKIQSFDQLNLLPDCINNQIEDFSFATWKDVISPDVIRIVVQGYKPNKIIGGNMYASGFRKNRSGAIEELAQDELYEFL
jgi:hypothetical protein